MAGSGTSTVSQSPTALPTGPVDAITDVAGVRVAHVTLADGAVQTGCTVVMPGSGFPYREKFPAGVAVINGFGKSAGLVQVAELGTLESPIALVNTFGISAGLDAVIRWSLDRDPEIARADPTVNAVVLECNDGWLHDARSMALQPHHVSAALANLDRDRVRDAATASERNPESERDPGPRRRPDVAVYPSPRFARGSVGAGRGMTCFGLKGGIGTASAVAGDHVVGALVLANFGRPEHLVLEGRRLGPDLAERLAQPDTGRGLGSIIVLLATDAPCDARQLTRIARRAGVGIARTGSDWDHGSGDIALAWSTAWRIPQDEHRPMPAQVMLHERALDPLFHAAALVTERAIADALVQACTVTGRDGHTRRALCDLFPEYAVRRDRPASTGGGPP